MISFSIGDMIVTIDWGVIPLIALLSLQGYLYLKKYFKDAPENRFRQAALILGFAVLLSVVIHELAHSFAVRIFGYGIESANFSFLAASVTPYKNIFTEMTWYEEIIIALAGPLANFTLGGICAFIIKRMNESLLENSIQFIGWANIYLGRLNLLPFLLILDGGKVADGLFRILIQSWIPMSDDTRLTVVSVLGAVGLVWYLLRDRGRKVKRIHLEDKLIWL